MELKIYNRTGEQKAVVSLLPSSQWTREVNGENVVSLSFKTWEFFMLDVNDYIELGGCKFKIKKEYRPKQISTQEYSYQVHFYGREHDAEDIKLCRLTQGEDDLEVTFAYEATPLEMLTKVVQNLNRNTDGVTWKAGEAVDAPRQTFEFNDVFCWDALNNIAAQLETEWWVDGDYLNLCKCERGESVSLGYLQGLTSMTQQENSNTVRFFTRLIPRGSTKNIDRSKYGYDRLQLPSRAKFIDLNTKYGLKEHVEEAAFEGIFPHRVGTISAVRSEEKENEQTGKFTVYYIKDSGLPFNPGDYMLGSEVIHLTFRSGNLQGKDFEVNWNYDTQEFEIINIYPDADTQLPGGNMIPGIGNTYILWNLRMPESYTAAAEQEYEAAVNNFLSEYAHDTSIYSGNTDYIYVDANKVPLLLGQRVHLLSSEYFGETGYRDSRITKISCKLENLSIATIECCNAVGRSWKNSIESSIRELKYTLAEQQKKGEVKILKTGDAEVPSEYNVFSALRALGEFISKKKDDIARGMITFLKGIKIGKFVPGWIGSGAAITVDPKTGKTKLEVDEVLARDRFETMEFRFNRIDVIDGEQWSTFAFGKVKSVDTENRIVYLDLVDGELTSVHVNDLLRGIFHNISSANATGNKIDDCGFYTMAGFSTSYFTPTEMLADGSGFKYTLRPGSTQHPCAEMKFAAYGNLTDPERRMSRVTNTKHTIYLKDVATWQIDPDLHYGAAYGDLTGITVNGVTFKGYSSFQTNGYFKGHIEFLPEQLEELKGDGGYSVSLTSYDAIVAVDSQGRIDSSVYDLMNVVDGEELVVSGDSEVVVIRYKIQTAIQAFKGAVELAWSTTPGEGTYAASFSATGCTCVLNGGILTVTGISEDKAAVVIEVNCEGEVVFTKNFILTRVYGGVNPDWTTYVFKQSEEKPAIPSGTELIPSGWSDAPAATGKWWMSKAVVSGITKLPGKWSEPVQVTCEDGSDVDFKYAKNNSENKAPGIIVTDRYPSGWSDNPPSLGTGEYLWMSKARIKPDNTLLDSWSDPVRISGEKGYTGDWTSYVFKQSDSRPAAPSGTDPLPSGWSDGPGASGKWWMSKASISGITGEARDWSIPVQVTGQDGNGMYYEYAVNSSETNAPTSGWSTSVPSVPSGRYLWMRWGQVIPPATYPSSWEGVSRITGEKGEQGQQGIQGIQGEQGERGLAGPSGSNGQTTYFHIKYSYNANGNPMTEDSSAPYIGTYVDYNPTDSSYYYYYTWRRFQGLQGDKGEQGIPGVNGDDGLTYYTHIKYSNDGGKTFTSNNGETSGSYIGFCVDLNVNDPSYVSAYKWSKIKGEDGQDGQDANLLDWVQEWNGTKTTINGESILSPKAYFGTVSSGKLSTGVLLGRNVYENGKAGIYGFKNGELVFKLNSEGENKIGGWDIEQDRISSTNAGKIYIYQDGGRFMTLGGSGKYLISGRCDGGTGISLYTQDTTGIGMTITAQTGAKAIVSRGSHYLIQRSTEKWCAPGALWAGIVGAYGGLSMSWGNGAGTVSASRVSAGLYKIYHGIGHTDYIPVAIAHKNDDNNAHQRMFCSVDELTGSYVTIKVIDQDGSWCNTKIYITLIGRCVNPTDI